MRVFLVLFFVWFGISCQAQLDSASYRKSYTEFWKEQNEHYHDKKDSPLNKKARKIFEGHRVYAFDLSFVIQAKFVKASKEDTVSMKTSADTEKLYVKYGQLHFNLGRNHCHLTVYQSLALREMDEYKSYLFIPFKDLTSGTETYGGGRYLDVLIPEGNTMILDFNKAYNPYCAYTDGYFCPVPPAENTLSVAIKAGAQAPGMIVK